MPIRSERRFISLTKVSPGMMVEFTYSKKSGGTGKYTVLVVDPSRENEHASEPQLHGFIINELNDAQLIEFFASFGKSINLDSTDRRASVMEGLNTDEAYTTFASSKYVKSRSYRTFNISGISQLRQVLLGSVE
tara:strand:+ start:2600 stop:3001 length:402 start_codon:yes stop_codon:yes gene_type:complete